MIPLYHHTASHAQGNLPATHYLLAANGLFLVQDTLLFRATTRITHQPQLKPTAPSLQMRFPRLPQQLLEEAYGFFLELYRRYESEGFAFILYSPDQATFSLAVPSQRLTYYDVPGHGPRMALGVHYDAIERPAGSLVLGDIHSHGRHCAYFSSTDNHDDLTRNGLHLVMGNLHQALPDLCVSFVTNCTRFSLSPTDVLEPFHTPIAPPQCWLDQVTVEPVSAMPHVWAPSIPHTGGIRP
jgi:PRTRC genetic system protein A